MANLRSISALLLAVTLAACNSGGGGESAAPAVTPAGSDVAMPSSSLRYDVLFDGNAINVVNREVEIPQAQPVFTIRDASGAIPRHWKFETADFAGSISRNITTRRVMFVDYGKFYRLDLISPQTPQAVQVSSESQAGLICDEGNKWTTKTEIDSLAYQLPGPDQVCGTNDDIYRRVILSMDAQMSPDNITQEQFKAIPLGDNRIELTGFLSLSGGGIVWRDAEFANPVKLASYANASKIDSFGLSADSKHELIAVEVPTSNGKTGIHLHILDLQNHSLSPSLAFTHDGNSANGTFNFQMIGRYQDNFYLSRNQTDIIKLPANGSSPASVVASNASGYAIVADQLIAARAGYNGDGSTDLYHLPLNQAGAAFSILKSNVAYSHITQERVYYVQYAFADSETTATTGSIKPDGGDELSYPNSLLIGGALANQTDRAMSFPYTAVDMLLLNFVIIGNQYSGNSLSVVNAANGVAQLPPIAIASTPPTTLNNMYASSGSRGNTVLGSGLLPGSRTKQLFTLNTASGKLTLQGAAHNNAAWWSDWIAGK